MKEHEQYPEQVHLCLSVNQMKKGAVYITSGIIDDKEETVVNAVKAAGLEALEVNYQGEWVSVVARKN